MSVAVKNEKGFSMVDVLLAMMLLVAIVTALSGYHRALASRFALFSQYRQLWHIAGRSRRWMLVRCQQAGR